jgi:hypothetical protein
MRKVWRLALKSGAILVALAGYGGAIAIILARTRAQPVDSSTVALFGGGVALVTGLIALLKDTVFDAIDKPRLAISFWPFDRRDCHTTTFNDRETGRTLCRAHYFRLRIENHGARSAHDVEVAIEEVRVWKNRKYVTDEDFMPLRLVWSHWKGIRHEVSIPPDTYRHCDLGFVLEPKDITGHVYPKGPSGHLFWLETIVRPNAGRTNLLPGTYRIVLSASGRDVPSTKKIIDLRWEGLWKEDIDDLLAVGLITQMNRKPDNKSLELTAGRPPDTTSKCVGN